MLIVSRGKYDTNYYLANTKREQLLARALILKGWYDDGYICAPEFYFPCNDPADLELAEMSDDAIAQLPDGLQQKARWIKERRARAQREFEVREKIFTIAEKVVSAATPEDALDMYSVVTMRDGTRRKSYHINEAFQYYVGTEYQEVEETEITPLVW